MSAPLPREAVEQLVRAVNERLRREGAGVRITRLSVRGQGEEVEVVLRAPRPEEAPR